MRLMQKLLRATAPVYEPLERRQLLSATTSRGSLPNLDSSLQSTYQEYQQFLSSQPVASAPTRTNAQRADKAAAIAAVSTTFQSASSTPISANGKVSVQAFTKPGDIALLKAALTKLSGQKVSSYGREVDALIPVADLPTLSKLKSLRFAQESSTALLDVGPVPNVGGIADQATSAASAYGINGAGVKVGIISDSFNNNINPSVADTYSTDVSSGALPAGVQILNDNVPGTDEGRAIAQIIYNNAPGVSLAFATGENATGFVSQATMASSITALVNDGCNIIVDDLSSKTEPFFADGVVAVAAESAINSGVTYISAAGNLGTSSYASAWRSGPTLASGSISKDPSALAAPGFYGGVTFNFNSSGGTNDMMSFNLPSGAVFNPTLQWDSPYASNGGPGTSNQVDIYVLNAAGTLVEGGSSASVTQGTGSSSNADPIQSFSFQNSTGTTQKYNLMICCSYGTNPNYLQYIDFAGQATNYQFTQGGSTIFGHANASGVESVGAVSYLNTPAYGVATPVLESYSSTGGTPIIFTTSGTRLPTYGYRQSPEIVAPDDVFTTFFGTKIGNNAYPTFSGTSASAAEVAGLAALLIQKDPKFTPAQVDAAINANTIKMGSTTPNNQSGYGLVQALPVIASSVGNITGTVFSDNNANGIADPGEPGLSNAIVYIDKYNSGYYESGDPVTTSNTNGTFSFFNQSLGSTVVRVVTLSGYVPVVATQTVNVLGATTVSGIYLGMFPTIISGTSGHYNYTQQVDAQKSADFDILVGSTEVYVAPLSLISTTGFTFDLEGGNATLTVNFANGDPIPGGGVLYTPSGTGNSLIFNGSAAADQFVVDGDTTQFVQSTGLTSSVTADDVQTQTINGNGGNDDFIVATAQPETESLIFNGGLGTTTLNVNVALPNNGVGTTFNSGTTAGDIGVLNVSAGTWTFAGNPNTSSSSLTVNDSSNVVFAAGASGSGINTRQLLTLNVSTAGIATVATPAHHSDRAVLLLSNVSITGTGVLNMNANDLVVTNSNLASISALLASGYNNGAWNGAGIDSAAAAADTTHLTALGDLLNNVGNTPLYGSGSTLGKFDGLSSIPATAILVKYTYYGDTDLSGVVDGSDYSRIDNGYLQKLTGWYNGDFNYDNAVDGSDYTLIDNAYNMQGPGL
jgi:hypothetical protein